VNASEVLAWLERRGTRRQVQALARYGIQARRAFGVSMATLQSLSRQVGKDHALAAALWRSGWYEARMLATLVEDPERVTRAQMDAWVKTFDNWAICDTACFCLFDRTPFAFEKARVWSASPREFEKRAGFALMACLAGHDRTAPDSKFLPMLPRIERGARDERNFVKKSVSWALRRIGERSPALHAAALASAKRLAQSEAAACRWVGKDALRALTSPQVRARVGRRAKVRSARR
jgi:3-methyladenine DNA glycosylase AlkD